MAENGDLCLVIGCDKSTSWGIATFSNSFERTSHLQFRQITEQGNRVYTWDHSGAADVRVGPGQGENQGLHPPHGSSAIRNQCLFVRVLKIKLSDRAWTSLDEVSGVSIKTEGHSLGKNLALIPRRHGVDRTREQHGQPSRIPVYKGKSHGSSFPTSPGRASSAESLGIDDLPTIDSGSHIISVCATIYFIISFSVNLRRICAQHLSSMTTCWIRFASTLLYSLRNMMLWFFSFQMQRWQWLKVISMHQYSLLYVSLPLRLLLLNIRPFQGAMGRVQDPK